MSNAPLALLDINDAQSGMVTRQDLAELLKQVNVEEVAREARVATKTVYRLRNMKHSPTLDTVERILAAIKRLKVAA